MPLGEAEPLWQIWEILQVALKGDGVTVQAPCSYTEKKRDIGRLSDQQ